MSKPKMKPTEYVIVDVHPASAWYSMLHSIRGRRVTVTSMESSRVVNGYVAANFTLSPQTRKRIGGCRQVYCCAIKLRKVK